MDPDQQLRNLRDFLLVYNRMTEICFQRCTSNFNYRNLTMDEERCVDSCAGKLIRSNHRLMGTYVQLMPRMVQRRMEEMESKAAESAKAAEAATVGTAATSEASPAFPTSINSPPLETDVIPQLQSSVLKSEGLDILADTTATGAKLSPATPPTPATETVLIEAPHTARSTQSSMFQADSGSSEAASLSVKVSTAATTESKTEKP